MENDAKNWQATGSVPEWAPRWSPDGQSIVFYGYENGNRDIWLMAAAGGPARQLTQSEAADLVPAWVSRW